MKRINCFFIVLLVSLPGHCFSLTAEEVLSKLRDKYSNVSRIEYKTIYELFKTHTSSEIVSSYNGYVYREGELMYQKIHSTEFVYGVDFSLKINADEKAIQLNKRPQTLDLEFNLDETLQHCRDKSVKEMNGYYSITLTIHSTSLIPLSVIKMRVDKKGFSLLQLDLYYSVHQDFSTDYKVKDLQRPHLRIRFTDITFTPSDNRSLFKLERYIEKRKDYLLPATTYKEYTFIDTRI